MCGHIFMDPRSYGEMIISWVPLWRDDHWYMMVEGARLFGWIWIEVWYQRPIAQWWTWTASLAELIFHDFCSFFNGGVVVVLHPRDCFDAIFSLGRNWSWIWTCDSDQREGYCAWDVNVCYFGPSFNFIEGEHLGEHIYFFGGDTRIPSRQLTSPTLGNGKSSSRRYFWGGNTAVLEGKLASQSQLVARCNPKGDEPCCSPGGWRGILER